MIGLTLQERINLEEHKRKLMFDYEPDPYYVAQAVMEVIDILLRISESEK